MPKPARLVSMVLLIAFASSGAAAAQPPTHEVDTVVYGHIDWVLDVFEGDALGLTEADVAARFDENFLSLVPPDEFIVTVQQLAATLGPLELVEDQSRHAGAFVGLFEAESGERVTIAFAVDADSGLMAGFFITPIGRSADAAIPAASPASTPHIFQTD